MKHLILISISIFFLYSCQNNSGTKNEDSADLIITNAKVAVMNHSNSISEAIAIKDGLVLATGSNAEIEKFKSASTKILNGNGRTLIPGLNDSHLHLTRGGRFFNAELRWDGVKSLKRALEMLKEQAERTPEGQWVRVIGGWSPFQFEEKRFPTPE